MDKLRQTSPSSRSKCNVCKGAGFVVHKGKQLTCLCVKKQLQTK